MGHKQTSRPQFTMSALPPKADIRDRDPHVRYGPEGDKVHCSKKPVIASPRQRPPGAAAEVLSQVLCRFY
jgi:hypothetical protein